VHTATIFVIAEDLATVVWHLPFGLKVISVMFESLPRNVLAGLRLMVTAASFVVGTETVSIKISDFPDRMGTRPFLDIKVWNASFHGGRRVDKSAFVHVYYLSTFWRGVFQHACGVDFCGKGFYLFGFLSSGLFRKSRSSMEVKARGYLQGQHSVRKCTILMDTLILSF
jgi:hypothetical protein